MPTKSSPQLPRELLSTIFLLLPPSHVFTSANRVCKAWHQSASFVLDESGRVALDVTIFATKATSLLPVWIPRFRGCGHNVNQSFQHRVCRTGPGTVAKVFTAGSVDVWISLPFLEIAAREPQKLEAKIGASCGQGLEHLGVKMVLTSVNDFDYDWKCIQRTSFNALSTFFLRVEPGSVFVRNIFIEDWTRNRLGALPSVEHVKCWAPHPGTSFRTLFDVFPNLRSLAIDPMPPEFSSKFELLPLLLRSGLKALRVFNHPKRYNRSHNHNEAILLNAVTKLPNVKHLGVLTLQPGIWDNHLDGEVPEWCLHQITELEIRVVP
ncbi:hypothetical protein M427DRAFT_156157 [Gonapodya prolifera JEL478]|uniref:F-box domain-containing protein n=1 Tax=Gonapodya prolifera (strain JEL478) TaxID=1344416 RepID=A0A139ABW5_GONPJ|nr:hypothetical protein M427DRAFT_156157 [Gonapodya prolifera JEL478]|eukprot:KXS14149.1 hypothetical protein M427DRAFT_156157 [Gonapodya prolifera JEL478]